MRIPLDSDGCRPENMETSVFRMPNIRHYFAPFYGLCIDAVMVYMPVCQENCGGIARVTTPGCAISGYIFTVSYYCSPLGPRVLR
jgi:hypothetical protein